jgi:hypothetical protein
MQCETTHLGLYRAIREFVGKMQQFDGRHCKKVTVALRPLCHVANKNGIETSA